MPGEPRLDECINQLCPWSGKPVGADSLTIYRGEVVGFCNPGCRDKFEAATRHFEAALSSYVPEDDEDEAGEEDEAGDLPASGTQAG
jgi:hypothetical protein